MTLRTPPLRESHADAGASFTEFGGWEMPVDFGSIRAEHRAVRGSAGKFDVSHMGELVVSGPDAAALVDRLTTNDVAALDAGRAHYAAMTDEQGVMLDDTLVYHLPEGGEYLVVPNAGTDEATTERFRERRDRWELDAEVANRTAETALFAVQGPESPRTLGAVAEADVEDVARFGCRRVTVAGVECLVSRTGYTGEDGYEVFCDPADAATVWDALDCAPCGLGARDTLRIEMGYLLAGQDFDHETEPRTPFEAGIGFVVALDTQFVGRDALAAVAEAGVQETFVGIRLTERGVPRHGYDVTAPDGTALGHVTSGTMSPTLEAPIALGYLPVECADEGTPVRIHIRGEPKSGNVVSPPFLDGYQ